MNKRVRVVVPVLLGVGAAATWAATRDRAIELGSLSASGTVEATEADLGFQVAGRVDFIGPAEGDALAAGDEVARLDAQQLQAGRDAAAFQLEAARALLAEMERGPRPEEVTRAAAAARAAAELEADARREADRTRRLHEAGAVSRQAMERAGTSSEVAAATREQADQTLALVRRGPRTEAITAQRARVRQAEANLAQAEAALAHTTVRAPFPGLVTVRHRQPGETVTPGAPVLTLLDPQDRWVRIYVREDRIGRVSLGQEAHITSDTYPDRVFSGTVVFIGTEAEFTPRNVQTQEERTKLVYPVKVRVTGDPTLTLKPGIPADVTLLQDPAP